MELKTIRQVSLDYGISRQMLCYYEEIGLLKSSRKDDYAYRVYDDDAVRRLQQIIVLRKLQIPMKQIKDVLNNQNAAEIIEIFKQNINELDEQITALSTVKSILSRLVDLNLDLLNDKSVLAAASSLSFSENKIINNVKGNVAMEKMNVENLNKAHETLNKLKRSDGQVRIIYVPPMTVSVDNNANPTDEEKAVKEKLGKELVKIKPDVRLFAVFHCSIEDLKDLDTQSDEGWASIPDDMELPAFLTKKTFEGGLYAAHLVRNGSEALEDVRFLAEWISASENYEFDDERLSFAEFLNYYNWMPNHEENAKRDDSQSDMLLPIKKIAE
jgi:DNA-binding transcriptional MerR regulator